MTVDLDVVRRAVAEVLAVDSLRPGAAARHDHRRAVAVRQRPRRRDARP